MFMFRPLFAALPNTLTLLRVMVVPLIIGVFYLPSAFSEHEKNLIATVLFIFASLTDWLDGWVARQYQLTSSFGAFLDPVADKLLVCSTLIALVEIGRVSALIALIIIGREIAISALREWMAQLRHRVRVSNIGKWKTAVQMLGIGFLLYAQPLWMMSERLILAIGFWLVVIAVVLTIASMFDYLYNAYKVLHDSPTLPTFSDEAD